MKSWPKDNASSASSVAEEKLALCAAGQLGLARDYQTAVVHTCVEPAPGLAEKHRKTHAIEGMELHLKHGNVVQPLQHIQILGPRKPDSNSKLQPTNLEEDTR